MNADTWKENPIHQIKIKEHYRFKSPNIVNIIHLTLLDQFK